MAHRVIWLPRSNSVAFSAKRTLAEDAAQVWRQVVARQPDDVLDLKPPAPAG